MKPSSFLLVSIVFFSCGQPEPGDANYVEWVRDPKNGFHVMQTRGRFIYDLQLQPSEFVWIQRNGSFNHNEFESQRPQLDSLAYFVLNIRPINGRKNFIDELSSVDPGRRDELLYYFSFRFQDGISMQADQRRATVLYHFEQFGTKSFVFAFKKGDESVRAYTVRIESPYLDSVPIEINVKSDDQDS